MFTNPSSANNSIETKDLESSANVSEVFFAIAMDYKYIKGRGLVIFELGPALTSDTKITKPLYGENQVDKILDKAVQIADEKKQSVYYDIDAKFLNRERKKEIFNPIAFLPDFYADSSNKGVVVTGQGNDITRASLSDNPNILTCNIHSVPIMKLKYLFYYHCQRISALNHYIPKTWLATKNTLEEIKATLPEGEYYVKPNDGTLAMGIQCLKKENLTWGKLISSEAFKKTIELPNRSFIIQEAVSGDHIKERMMKDNKEIVHERTRRVFAIIHGNMQNPEKLSIELHLPYYSVSTPNERFFKLQLKVEEAKEIENFYRTLLTSLYDPKLKRFPRHWESMISNWNQNSSQLSASQKEILLAQIGQAMNQEMYHSAEKINVTNIANLAVFFKKTTEEREKLNFDILRFFIYTLFGHDQLIWPKHFANEDLIPILLNFLKGNSSLSSCYGLVKSKINIASRTNQLLSNGIYSQLCKKHPLSENLAVLEKIYSKIEELVQSEQLTPIDLNKLGITIAR